MTEAAIDNDLVRYSRAGDEFHYRWAARRCLKLIYPNSELESITIEGSKENQRAGEYVIDVAEYYQSADGDTGKVIYFQLKHSSVRADKPFNLSDLKGTIEGFSSRYSEIKGSSQASADISFCIVSNRPFSDEFKNGLSAIASNKDPIKRFGTTIIKYTGFSGKKLKNFCACLELIEGEGDYCDQRYELQAELAQLLAGGADNSYIDSVITLVREHALPRKAGHDITCEDILRLFGVTSKNELFPASPKLEQLSSPIIRLQHDILLGQIVGASTPVIIHASGGIGKSVIARQLADNLPKGSLGIVYDCFAAGEYRNPSVPRHRHREALVQIANEIAAKGYCDPLLPLSTSQNDALLRSFMDRLRQAAAALKECHDSAILAVFIDAADNAEMVAKEVGDSCFAKDLLRVGVPAGCRIIELSRSERVHLLEPQHDVHQIELDPFNEDETLSHLRLYFPNANPFDGLELRRLSGGNPRVQANALNVGYASVPELLQSLGPEGTSVNEQIAEQLQKAIVKVKESFTADFQGDVDAICHGLAILPPYVPISVLAVASGVSSETVKSFIADLGHPFMHSENSVQFRDEPTETWFRNEFSSSNQQIALYITRLKPLAAEFSYVAQVLPSLLLRSEEYEELIQLALSDKYLPDDNPIDARDIRVYRLQFAFKAALKKERYADAMKLAFLAGEEVAGNNRQIELLTKNVDLINTFQSQERVQEIAFRRLLHGGWQGSENVYSASILSSADEFKGEARAYLRSAENWLHLYFDDRKKGEGKNPRHEEQLDVDDIVELITSHYNLFGLRNAVDYLLSWTPLSVIYQVASVFVRRLIDAGKFEVVNKFALQGAPHPYLMVAVAHQLIQVGRFPPTSTLQPCLDLLSHKRTRIQRAESNWEHNDWESYAVISFLEACIHAGLSRKQISRVLKHYTPQITFHSIDQNYPRGNRELFLRSIACKAILDEDLNPNIEALMPKSKWEQSEYDRNEETKKFTQIVGGLLPWYLLRIQAIERNINNLADAILTAEQASSKATSGLYQRFDSLPFEISEVHFLILSFASDASPGDIKTSVSKLLDGDSKFRLSDRLIAARTAFRSTHLSSVCADIERSCRKEISSAFDEHVEDSANSYVELSRAVLSASPDDAVCYFNEAIEVVSKFGDEAIERWDAVMAVATRTSEGSCVSPEAAYRFMRCAELIGNYIDREKNFDRDEVIRICTRLHPPSVFTGLSRWRDRDIGRLYRQIPALAKEIVKTKVVSPLAAWSLSTFYWEYDFAGFAATCIEQDEDPNHRQFIFDSVVHDLRLRGANESAWNRLEEIAQQHSLAQGKLTEIKEFLAMGGKLQHENDDSSSHSSFHHEKETSRINWACLLDDLCLTDTADLSTAINRIDALDGPRNYEEFWPEVFKRVSEDDAREFLLAITDVEYADLYDVGHALSHLPESWCNKVSVQRVWPKVLNMIGQRFSSELTNRYQRNHFLKSIKIKQGNEFTILHDGIVSGLASSSDLASASMFFNFIEMIAPSVAIDEAAELLEFALHRFELHIDDSFSDGPWDNWLNPPDNAKDAFTGYIWAGLGSPRSEMRWEAAHCVRRLAESGCKSEIDSLISWAKKGSADAFVGHLFPFYDLHARLYLLMALARVALDCPEILKQHSALFADYALSSMHVLIQQYAADITQAVETSFPGTYEAEILEKIRNVNVSLFPARETEGYHREQLDSPWHKRGEVDQGLELYFGYDFDRYWFDSMEHVFGISVKQFEELAREIVIKQWAVKTEDKFIRDPRLPTYRERETWHSHSAYPRTDDYKFYISYHAMFTVAAKLLQKMPILNNREWHGDEWGEWLNRHSLTRSDGRWLADRRDPAPLHRRAWVFEPKRKDWRWEIMPNDFLDGLLFERDGENWLNIFGSWSDIEERHEERFSISSALVAPEASSSLLNALSTFNRCHDYKLPNYHEDDFEFGTPPFSLNGWIVDKDVENRLDKFDPAAANISFPPYQVGTRFSDHFELQADIEKRAWRLPSSTNASLICEIWSDESLDDSDSPARHGKRMGASLEFLLSLSREFNSDIILEVQIERHMCDYAGRRDRDEFGYTEPYCKLYVLSQDGRLRDASKSYQLRKEVSS